MNNRVEIQDNTRENELRRIFNLKKSNTSRIGHDALLHIQGVDIFFELKSSTRRNVSSANNLNLAKINKWKNVHWIIGMYNKNATLSHCYYGTPLHMNDWLSFWENDIKRGLKISDMMVDRIDKEMVYEIFGKKDYYTYEEAQFVYKSIYTKQQYMDLMDNENGYSIDTMLNMFKKHNKFYLYRGASINNPYIQYDTYSKWIRIDNNYAKELCKHVKKYLKQSVQSTT